MNGKGHGTAGKLNRKEIGAAGEDAASRLLEQNNYRILHRNWRCRTGELDIVASIEGTLVVVEVRSRSNHSSSYGTAAESVNYRKMNQVRSTAEVYLYQHRLSDRPVRFDVITVLIDRQGQAVSTDHLISAF